ncbi:MAG: acylphosphatase [Rhodobacteraceae bacterium]|nr:acylphosphatase [Paracoccaceae bacterium]
MSPPVKTLCVSVTGRVQGVSFRAWTMREAEALGLAGWVRNERDGSVTALISGPAEDVAQMLARLHHGPRFARVTSVTAEETAPPKGAGFEIAATSR